MFVSTRDKLSRSAKLRFFPCLAVCFTITSTRSSPGRTERRIDPPGDVTDEAVLSAARIARSVRSASPWIRIGRSSSVASIPIPHPRRSEVISSMTCPVNSPISIFTRFGSPSAGSRTSCRHESRPTIRSTCMVDMLRYRSLSAPVAPRNFQAPNAPRSTVSGCAIA